MFNDLNPKQGSILIAEPFMLDDNFERSVLLLCQHDNELGSFAVILNQKSQSKISIHIDEFTEIKFPIFIGGPVQTEDIFFIHRVGHLISGGVPLYEDIYFGGSFEELTYLIKDGRLESGAIKFFKGYAGWQENQLMQELDENSWAVHNRYPSDLPFVDDGENLWKRALIDLGPKYAHVANFPKSSDFHQN